MKTKSAKKLSFADLPRDYAGLCGILLPRPIRDKEGLADATEIVMIMAGFEDQLSEDQDDYLDLVSGLIEDYEAEHVKMPKRTPLQLLQYLLGEHGLTAADLTRILGTSRNLGNAILRGERQVTLSHARKLGKRFSIPWSAFVE